MCGRSAVRSPEQGIATLSVVLVVPALLLAVSTVAQFVIVWHASHVAVAAAQEGARAAQMADGSTDAGRMSADDFIRQAGPHLVLGPAVTVTRSAESVVVVVRGTAPRLIPGFPVAVRGSASGPIEAFSADQGP